MCFCACFACVAPPLLSTEERIPCVTEYPGSGAFLFGTFAKRLQILQIMQHQNIKIALPIFTSQLTHQLNIFFDWV